MYQYVQKHLVPLPTETSYCMWIITEVLEVRLTGHTLTAGSTSFPSPATTNKSGWYSVIKGKREAGSLLERNGQLQNHHSRKEEEEGVDLGGVRTLLLINLVGLIRSRISLPHLHDAGLWCDLGIPNFLTLSPRLQYRKTVRGYAPSLRGGARARRTGLLSSFYNWRVTLVLA